ncbi:YhcH/YjgK/YiaL family protein [Clostridium thermarum]|uniref:YhcH/YjgK/YiaL family protein n=1 Tax=Clostridium thermarum TaxID=1716543 RepID=UPI0013D853C0|nr:YhcH/YjgK/YiaL family protein [Clostridium thermarum]
MNPSILDRCKNLTRDQLNGNDLLRKGLEFLSNTDLLSIPLGRQNISETIYANVEEYVTKPWSEGKFEAHNKYIDIQYMIDGEEIITIAPVEQLDTLTKYSEEKDISFYKDTVRGKDYIIKSGEFLVIYPQHAHRPCIATNKPQKVKKIVVKVKV